MPNRVPVGPTPRILVVDDQPEVRLLFVTALAMEGYDVCEASSAHEGLSVMRDLAVSLVLTDYAMPGGTGTNMLRAAQREGLLERTSVVILTAHPVGGELDGFDVWHKPIELDQFLRQIAQLVGTPGHPVDCTANGTMMRVEFVLYVTDHSIPSLHARRNVEAALEHFDRQQVRMTIVNPSQDPAAADRDCVTLTPVLVRRAPKPKVWVLGDLRDTELLIDVIAASGLEPVEDPR